MKAFAQLLQAWNCHLQVRKAISSIALKSVALKHSQHIHKSLVWNQWMDSSPITIRMTQAISTCLGLNLEPSSLLTISLKGWIIQPFPLRYTNSTYFFIFFDKTWLLYLDKLKEELGWTNNVDFVSKICWLYALTWHALRFFFPHIHILVYFILAVKFKHLYLTIYIIKDMRCLKFEYAHIHSYIL